MGARQPAALCYTLTRSVQPSPSGPTIHVLALAFTHRRPRAGRIGSTFAFQLARTGHHDVTLVARPGSLRLQELQRQDGIVNTKGERATVRVVDTLDEQVPYDLVVVTLLAHQVDAVLPTLQRCAARCIQFMFVTFEPERLPDAVGKERCSFGMPFVQANFDGEGRLKAPIGAAGQKTIMGQQRWVDVFIAAGLPAALEPDMPLWLRCRHDACQEPRVGQRDPAERR